MTDKTPLRPVEKKKSKKVLVKCIRCDGGGIAAVDYRIVTYETGTGTHTYRDPIYGTCQTCGGSGKHMAEVDDE